MSYTGSAALLSVVAIALVGCDPPPTSIPPGAGYVVPSTRPAPPAPPATPIEDTASSEADAGSSGGSSGGGSSAGGGTLAPDEGEASSNLVADGGLCERGVECQSGICEGEGCTVNRKGTCMSRNRSCTRDLRAYCGCDGKTFRASGSCPARRFSSRQACRR